MHISKGLYLLDNFGKLNYEGSVRIESGFTIPNDKAVYYVFNIFCDEIELCIEGFEAGEYGSDTFNNVIFGLGDLDDEISDEEVIEINGWAEDFYSLWDNGKNLKTTDYVEDIENEEDDEQIDWDDDE